MNASYEFIKAVQITGLTPPENIIPDGKLHRFASNGKRGDDSGWYVFHEDGIPAGAFGDWRRGLSRTWRADIGRNLTPAEMAAHQARVDAANRAREEEETRRKAKAARKAAAILEAATQARGDHPYLVRKQVAPVASLGEIDDAKVAAILDYAPKYRGKPLVGRLLVVPVENAGELRTLELIDEAGRKSALYGGPKKGGCWSAQPLPDGDGQGLTLLIGEGVVTVLSAREATGYYAIAALSSGNLLTVAKAMRKRYPLAVLVVLVDLLKATGEPDPHAIEAARAVDGRPAVPDFGENRSEGLKDFNDMAAVRGLEAVRRAIADAKAPAEEGARPGNGAAKGGGPGNATSAGGATPAFLTAAALWDMKHAPPRWAVPTILPEGVTILGGKPKVGKSWLALDVALAVGTGGLALDTIQVEAGPVLYLALEDTKRRLTKRLRILCGDTKPPPEQIEFLTDCPRLGSGGEEVLRAWLRDHPTARLVVIDTLARFRPPTNAKETPYANDYIVGQYLSKLCVEFQVSILVLGHLRKQPGDDPIDEISGTLGLVGSVDGYMVLRRQAMSDEATLYVCGRDVDEPAERCLSWDRSRARWSITGGDPRVSRLPAQQRRVYELLSEAPRTIRELTETVNPGHVVTDPSSDQKYKNTAKLVYKLRDRELVFQRPYDKRWAPSTGKREREQGVQGEQGAQGEQGEHRTGNLPPVPRCSPSVNTREGEHELSNDAGSKVCSPVLPVPPRIHGTPDRATEDSGGHVGDDGPAQELRRPVDDRHLLPPAALAEMPPEDPSLPETRFSIVGQNALCVNIHTRSAWTGAQWAAFAQRHYAPFASVVGIRIHDRDTGGV